MNGDSNKAISEQVLQAQIDNLPLEMSPERDLWSGIERALPLYQQEAGTPSAKWTRVNMKMPLAWAASVIAAVLLTWVNLGPGTGQESQFNLVASIQQDFESQKKTMLVSFGQPNISQLPQEMQKQLNQLAAARASINKALVDDPNNADLLSLLRFTQQQELDLIQQLYSPQWQSI